MSALGDALLLTGWRPTSTMKYGRAWLRGYDPLRGVMYAPRAPGGGFIPAVKSPAKPALAPLDTTG
jgi:hypothetical protein